MEKNEHFTDSTSECVYMYPHTILFPNFHCNLYVCVCISLYLYLYLSIYLAIYILERENGGGGFICQVHFQDALTLQWFDFALDGALFNCLPRQADANLIAYAYITL